MLPNSVGTPCGDSHLHPFGFQPNAVRSLLLLPVAIRTYPLCGLTPPSFSPIATCTPQIMSYFDGGWAQKWAQSFGVNPSVETASSWHAHLPNDRKGD
jgi:hypothetical protein